MGIWEVRIGLRVSGLGCFLSEGVVLGLKFQNLLKKICLLVRQGPQEGIRLLELQGGFSVVNVAELCA